MSAHRDIIRVELGEDGWLTIHRGQAWLHGSREGALQEAREIAAQVINATIVVQAPERQEVPQC